MLTVGTFSYFELDQALGYLSKKNRHQVIDYLRKSHWIEYNGVDYEMSDRVKSFIYFIFTSLDRNDLSISQTIDLSLAEAEMSSMYNYSEAFAPLCLLRKGRPICDGSAHSLMIFHGYILKTWSWIMRRHK